MKLLKLGAILVAASLMWSWHAGSLKAQSETELKEMQKKSGVVSRESGVRSLVMFSLFVENCFKEWKCYYSVRSFQMQVGFGKWRVG